LAGRAGSAQPIAATALGVGGQATDGRSAVEEGAVRWAGTRAPVGVVMAWRGGEEVAMERATGRRVSLAAPAAGNRER